MSSRRKGQGKPIDQQAWPTGDAMRLWLVFCDKVHRANGMPSLSMLAVAMDLTSRTRVGEMLRGLALPADEAQARGLLKALGAVGKEIDRGTSLYKAAYAEHAQDTRDVGRPGWWQRSGYVEQVGDIAPLLLLDRDEELAELSAWCTGGDEAYVWWQAGPRAGKSALMAWFVLHPPAGVWVISFFVTARYTGQADSAAFTDGLLDQLAAITGVQIPPLTSAAARDRLRRQLLGEAAARAAKAGRRLVLVVDGLDEDCGSLPGSGLPSIAACLPKRPPDGLLVIVAGRPDPPTPADLDADHPLKTCRIRRLDVSPHATHVTELAQRELDEVLATDHDRHDGLGYQVLGLVTASGGGLDRRSLQQLTGRPTFEIDRLLRGVFGRTVAGRADPHTTERMFLFTHESLRIQAIDRLGLDTIAGFAERLHAWAAGYQHRGWPADTPAYLLRGYPRMLADAQDLDRLVSLATDPARHHRMLDATGGDAAALAEIATAHTLITTQQSPNLLVALRLAWYRDQLADRNTNTPASLPAVWAILGQPTRAEALAQSITDRVEQAWALAGVAAVVAGTGDHDRARALAADAEQIARSITHPYHQARALADLAAMVAGTGDHDRARALAADAEQIARSITDTDYQVSPLADVAAAVAGAGDHDRAEQIARSITDPYHQAQALADVAAAVAGAGDHDRARALAADAEQATRFTTHSLREAQALADLAVTVAVTVADAGDHDRAEQIARSITDPYRRPRALAGVAAAVADAGDHNRAEQIARSITDPYHQAQALADVAAAVAGAGVGDRARALAADAEQIARSITNSLREAQELTDLAAAVAGAGDHDRAEQIARSITDPYRRARALARVAAVAGAGDHDRARLLADDAEQIARSITDTITQTLALADVAAAVAGTGDDDRAEQIARSITDTIQRSQSLADVAAAVAGAGDHDRARALADDAEQIARSITDSYPQASALADVAAAVAGTGDHDRAEQIARSIARSYPQASALASLVAAVAGAGDHDRARALAADAEQIARSITDPDGQARALADLAAAVAGTGDHDRAEQIARSITDAAHQSSALASVAVTVAGTGDYDRAERIARSITDRNYQARAMADMAGVAGPARARLLLAGALGVGRWTIPLQALARIDSKALAVMAEECRYP